MRFGRDRSGVGHAEGPHGGSYCAALQRRWKSDHIGLLRRHREHLGHEDFCVSSTPLLSSRRALKHNARRSIARMLPYKNHLCRRGAIVVEILTKPVFLSLLFPSPHYVSDAVASSSHRPSSAYVNSRAREICSLVRLPASDRE